MLENILSNLFTQSALAIAGLGGLFSDQIGRGYWIVIILSLLMIVCGIYDEKRKQKIYHAPNLPIPIVFNISNPADSKSALNALFGQLDEQFPEHQKNLAKYFNITESDLIYKYDGDIFDEKRFIDFLKITKHDLKKLDSKTPKNIHFHIVYIGPIANAILIGTMLGTEGVTLYQYSKSTNSYTTQMEITDRTYKEHISDFEIIEKEILGDIEASDEVTVAIDLASHKVALNKLKEPIVHLKSKVGATLHTSDSFMRANQEIYAVINELQQNTSHIKLVYSMPTTVALLLGMSIQNYWDIEITQYVDGEYKSVMKQLDSVKYYF